MTDQLLSAAAATSEEQSPSALANALVGGPAGTADGYHTDNDSEKPVLLELGTAPNPNSSFNTDFPLDMHLGSNSTVFLLPSESFASSEVRQLLQPTQLLGPHLPLYTNPYTTQHHMHQQQTQHQQQQHILPLENTLTSLQCTGAINEVAHIPQTVCSWATATADMGDKSMAEIVPPAMYISYTGTSEHIITKHTNTWKEKALQIEKDYKKTACDRERTRMRDMNRAFDLLRSKLPISKPNGKKYSKIESLRIAINYINHLQGLLMKDIPEMESNSQDAVDYVVSTFQYQSSRKPSYKCSNLDKEMEELHSGTGAWSDSSYVANNGQHSQKWD